VLKSYSLKHELGDELFPLLKAYRDAVNSVIEELWNNIEWKKGRLVDIHSREYKKKLRDSLLEDWPYANTVP
jgi:hypothetical protein